MNKNLIACRKILGVSQTELAKYIGIGLTSYNQKETGKIPFTQEEMIKIKNFLAEHNINATIDQLFFSSEVSISIT